ncbi:hypothetical protein V5E97_01260 [Singulisphaera sp. Ch08]|uniref:Exosortase-associated EpsI family protein n=1 Tax=Singulisphaera sp. Ch08 TaxID=3120278 RepID=A0AAU7CHF7_9BACT
MGKLTKVVSGLTLLVPLAAVAEEPRTFPPLKPIRVGPFELRASTTKRGLAMLSTAPLPPQVYTIPGRIDSSVVETMVIKDDAPGYRGTVVYPRKGVEGDEARAQDDFVSRFPKLDPCPPARMSHFDWLPHYDDHPVRNAGWIAVVHRVERDHDGVWKVTVRFSPNIYSWSLQSKIWDYVEEIYRLEGDSIRQIASDAETPKPKAQVFPAIF